MKDEYPPGTPIKVGSGPFADMDGFVLRDRGREIDCELIVFGRRTPVTLTRDQIARDVSYASGDDPVPAMLDEIQRALNMRGYAQRKAFWWAEHATDSANTDAELIRIAAAFEAFEKEVDDEREIARNEVFERFHAAFDSLSAEDKRVKWAREKEEWTQWREEARQLTERFERAVGRDIARELLDSGVALRGRVRRAVQKRERQHRPAGDVSGTEPIATNAELEAAIEADLDGVEAYLVYGDWLTAHGDHRGELIALQAPSTAVSKKHTSRTVDELFEKHGRYLIANLGLYPVELDWHVGYLKGATIAIDRQDEADGVHQATLLEALLKLPSARWLRELTLGTPSVHEEGVIDAMQSVLTAAGPNPHLRKLHLITNQDEEMLSWTTAGHCDRWPELYPNLRFLRIQAGAMELGTFHFEHLEVLEIETCGLSTANVASICEATWPTLKRLRLWFGSNDYGAHNVIAGLERILSGEAVPVLEDLALANQEFAYEAVDALSESAVLPRLKRLDLSQSTLGEEGAALLHARRDAFAHLDELDLSDNYLEGPAVEQIQDLCKQVVIGNYQRTDEDGEVERYAAVWE